MPMHGRYQNLTVLIPAAGSGDRLGMGPKALLELEGKTLVEWVTGKALHLSDKVLVGTPQEDHEVFTTLCPGCQCVIGGATRQETVAQLLGLAGREWVLLTDVARPFITMDLYNDVFAAAQETGVAGAFLQSDVPVARIGNGRVEEVFRAEDVGLFQLPHVFNRKLLDDVYALADREGWQEQSTLELVMRAGHSVVPVAGTKNNIKLTTKEDWQLAQSLKEYLK